MVVGMQLHRRTKYHMCCTPLQGEQLGKRNCPKGCLCAPVIPAYLLNGAAAAAAGQECASYPLMRV